MSVPGVRIDQLLATGQPSPDHEVPAMLNGETHKLSVAQIAMLARLFSGTGSDFSFSSETLDAALRELGNALVANGAAIAARLEAEANLADLQNAGTARENLGISAENTPFDNAVAALAGAPATAQAAMEALAQGRRLRRVSVFEASGTYEKPAWLKMAIVEGVAGGASGGGSAGGADVAVGSGGGAGGHGKGLIAADDIPSEVTVTVGDGGAPAAAGNNDGNDGGVSSFGSLITCTGGIQGRGDGNGAGSHASAGGIGGTVSYAGSVTPLTPVGRTGQQGGHSLRQGGSRRYTGVGAPSPYGAGGHMPTGAVGSGQSGIGWGAGGSGAGSAANNNSGGAGRDGVWIIWEFE